MEWTLDTRRETRWRDWFAWYPVNIEVVSVRTSDRFKDIKCKVIWLEKIERRTIGLPNNAIGHLFRRRGSTWDADSYLRPESPKPLKNPPNKGSAGKRKCGH